MAARVEKTRGGGTFSESGFWGMIRAALRQKSRWWKPIKDAKEAARRPYTGASNRIKWEYQCAHCKDHYPEKEIEVDHIIEAGSLKTGADLEGFVDRLFCEVNGLQVLCKTCHLKKTQENRKKC